VDLDEAGAGAAGILMADFLERLYKTQNKAAEMSVRVY
jgi:hypothetical protein